MERPPCLKSLYLRPEPQTILGGIAITAVGLSNAKEVWTLSFLGL